VPNSIKTLAGHDMCNLGLQMVNHIITPPTGMDEKLSSSA